jgi:PAS domain S-box-containing protein
MTFAPGVGMPGRVWVERKAIWLDIEPDMEGPRGKAVHSAGIVVAFFVPVVAAGEFVALLEFGATTRRPEYRARLELVSDVADDVGGLLAQLRSSRQNASFVAALDGLQEGVAILSPYRKDGRLRPIHCNAAYLKLLGCASMEEVRDAFAEDRLTRANPELMKRMRAELRSGRPSHAVTMFRRMDGTDIEVEVSIAPVRDASGGVLMFALIIRDLTEIRAGEARSRELQESLQRAETVAALGRIVAGVAHEVRNPLFGIGATLDALEARMGGDDAYASYIKILRGELSRMTVLMRDLLDYGRPARLSKATCSLVEIVDDAIERCAKRAHELGVGLSHVRAASAPLVMIDRGRVLQVVINLVENAILHSPSGKPVVVEHDVRDGMAVLRVKDSGPGIPPEDLPHLFEPFFTKRKGGTGLGLSIVQRIMVQHGGRVEAENTVEGGAAMTVHLPVEAEKGG